MKKTTAIAALLMLCAYWPQAKASAIQPLKPNDKVPDIQMQLLNYPKPRASLAELGKNKLLILDFWSTWCSACFGFFPHLDSLQAQFKDSLQVILVNTKSNVSGDNASKINTVLQRLEARTGKAMNLPVVYECPLLDTYFPCTTLPHEVWIKDGRVVAITSAMEVTALNIRAILTGRKMHLHEKKDIPGYGDNKLLLSSGKSDSSIIYRTLITGYMEGIGSSSGFRLKNGIVTGCYVYNSSLFSLAKEAYNNEIDCADNRIIVESADRYFALPYNDTAVYSHTYCYDLLTPPVGEDSMRSYMQSDLKRYFNISVHKAVRTIKCLVITNGNAGIISSPAANPSLDIEAGTVKKYICGYTPARVAQLLNRYTTLPLIDETAISTPVDINLPADLNDVAGLQKAFQQCGLRIREEERPLQVVIITNL